MYTSKAYFLFVGRQSHLSAPALAEEEGGTVYVYPFLIRPTFLSSLSPKPAAVNPRASALTHAAGALLRGAAVIVCLAYFILLCRSGRGTTNTSAKA